MQLFCAGEAFEDLIFVGLDRLPELGEEIKTDRFTATIGGGAVITAVHAARLGMRTHLVSAFGNATAARLKHERVSATNLKKPGEPHAISAALSTTDDRAFVTFNGVNSKLEERLATFFRRRPTADSRKLIADRRQPTHIHFCFYPHDCRYWADLLVRFRRQGITTSWDFGWNEPLTNDRGLTDLIDALDFVFVNEHEARLYTGSSTLEESIPAWRERKAITIIKLGEQGAVWLAPQKDIHVPAPKVKVVDTTGAGDAFNAGFLVSWLHGLPPARCLKAGNKVGAESTRSAGGV